MRSGSLYKSDAGHFNYIDNRDAEVVSSKLTWKIGDKCMAPWIDGKVFFCIKLEKGLHVMKVKIWSKKFFIVIDTSYIKS